MVIAEQGPLEKFHVNRVSKGFVWIFFAGDGSEFIVLGIEV